jgi:hypothetical protein
VPVAATRLADVGTRDSQPLVLGGRGQHFLEQVAVASLELVLLAKRDARFGDSSRQGVAHPLELFQPRDARLVERRRDPRVEGQAGEGLRAQGRELVLEAGDLTTQLDACEALVASHSKRGECVSIE